MAKTPSVTANNVAAKLHPTLLRLYLLYTRQTDNQQFSQAQVSILMLLNEQGPLRVNQIAAAEAIRMPTASNAVNQLEMQGLVTRIRDVNDRRGVRVDLTPKGRKQLIEQTKERSENLARMMESLTEEELAGLDELSPILEALLRRITDNHTKSVSSRTSLGLQESSYTSS